MQTPNRSSSPSGLRGRSRLRLPLPTGGSLETDVGPGAACGRDQPTLPVALPELPDEGVRAGSAALALRPTAWLRGMGPPHRYRAPAAGDVERQLLAHSAIPRPRMPHRVQRDVLRSAAPFMDRWQLSPRRCRMPKQQRRAQRQRLNGFTPSPRGSTTPARRSRNAKRARPVRVAASRCFRQRARRRARDARGEVRHLGCRQRLPQRRVALGAGAQLLRHLLDLSVGHLAARPFSASHSRRRQRASPISGGGSPTPLATQSGQECHSSTALPCSTRRVAPHSQTAIPVPVSGMCATACSWRLFTVAPVNLFRSGIDLVSDF